jgi:AP-1-like factor
MMESFPANMPLWDMNNTDFANIPEDDFLALLQKEFPVQPGQPGTFATVLDATQDDPDGINPQSLSALPIPGGHSTPPLTDDSSPSPSSTTNEVGTDSRRHSASYPGDGDGLKRKASEEDLEDGGARKNAHGGS